MMATAEVESAPAPALPDYLTNPNAVLKDASQWRYGRAPDYSKTRIQFEQTKKQKHEAASLPSLVENLVKNWEIEASFKPQLSDWRTIDHPNYSFAINGGPPQTAEYMLKVGTYNAIIAANEFYSPANSDFASSHKTFKRMMPTFAWEVVEVYSGPPQVAFRWRHWGEMKNDYVGFNDKGEKITAKAHNGHIDIEGVTVALVDDQVRLQKVETWFDPLEMFRQIAPNGIVNKEIQETKPSDEKSISKNPEGETEVAQRQNGETTIEPQPANDIKSTSPPKAESSKPAVAKVPLTQNEKTNTQTEVSADTPGVSALAKEDGIHHHDEKTTQNKDTREAEPSKNSDSSAPSEGKPNKITPFSDSPAATLAIKSQSDVAHHPETEPPPPVHQTHQPQPGNQDQLSQILAALQSVQSNYGQISAALDKFDKRLGHLEAAQPNTNGATPEPGDAVAATPDSEETRRTHEEMGRITAAECPFLMNRE